MQNNSFLLRYFSTSLKWTLTCYFFLVSLGFGVALLQSYERYQLNHQKTIEYYLGNPEEGEMALAKPLGYLVPTTHVHSFMMPVIFLTVWIALQGVSLGESSKKIIISGGLLSMLIYNAAPYLLRYQSPKYVHAFTVGGIGLFLFFFIPVLLIYLELFKSSQKK
ncbi:MAG: hypothetical protein JNK65_07860 [Deltaproteobacteria bacterium]|nr:hypothetical protein [Deltaproteobacteria bacterium]